MHHRYSRKRRQQAASTDIPKIKEAGCAHCCFSRRNRIARKRDTKNGPRRQRAEMTLSLPDPAYGDWAQYDKWALSARISEALPQMSVETGLGGWACRTRTQKCRRKLSL